VCFFAESMFPDRSDFDYDYETLRTTGVILAVIMFVSGILIALTHLVPKFQRQRVSSLSWREM
uniref:FXYD domain-containing ion transport regulator n=1 Tax=Sphaeramia orbicularis TaxID=375764 RepID=A0A673A930_9TELE